MDSETTVLQVDASEAALRAANARAAQGRHPAWAHRGGNKPGQKLRPKHQIRSLAIQINGLKLKGFSRAEIADALGIPESTCYYYLQEFRRLNKSEFDQLTAHTLAFNLFLTIKDRVQSLWKLYASTHDDKVKVACLDALRKEDESLRAHAQSLGIVASTPAQVQVGFAPFLAEAQAFLAASDVTPHARVLPIAVGSSTSIDVASRQQVEETAKLPI